MEIADRLRTALRGKGVKEKAMFGGGSKREMNGRRYEGYIRVDPARCDARALRQWLNLAEQHVAALPRKRSRK